MPTVTSYAKGIYKECEKACYIRRHAQSKQTMQWLSRLDKDRKILLIPLNLSTGIF